MAGPLDREESSAALALLDAAAKQLADGDGGVPGGFVASLLGRVAPEDLLRYGPQELAAFARDGWTFLTTRKPGAAKVRFDLAPATIGGQLKPVSVIEIVNDDMPFLVDSVMGELTDRGLDVRLIAHPILTVERDKSGMLTGPPSEGRGKNGGSRESFIHVISTSRFVWLLMEYSRTA